MKWRDASGRKPAALLLELRVSVYFSSQKEKGRWGGGGGRERGGYNLLKNVFQAFIATGHSYSNSGIPWMWFSTCCCLELWGTDLWRLLPVESAVAGAKVRHLDIRLLVWSAIWLSLFRYLKRSHMAALIGSRHVKAKKKKKERKKASWSSAVGVFG